MNRNNPNDLNNFMKRNAEQRQYMRIQSPRSIQSAMYQARPRGCFLWRALIALVLLPFRLVLNLIAIALGIAITLGIIALILYVITSM